MKRKQTAAQLSRRAQRIILALLEQPTQEKAAQAAGVSKATLWRWQQKPEFQRAWLEVNRQKYSQVFARLQQAAPAAATTLMRVMTDPKAPHSSRVRAATSVLGNVARGIEVQDFDVRLRELETSRPDGFHLDQLDKAA